MIPHASRGRLSRLPPAPPSALVGCVRPVCALLTRATGTKLGSRPTQAITDAGDYPFSGCPEQASYALALSLNNKLVPAGRSSGIDAEYAALSADAESAFAAQAEYFGEAFVGGDYYATFFDPLAEVLARGLGASKCGAAFLREHVLAIDLVPYFSQDFAEPKRRSDWDAHAQGVADDLLSTLLDAHPPSVIFANGKATKPALEAQGSRFEHTVEVTNRSGAGAAMLNLGRLGDAPIVHSNFLRKVYGPNSAEELAATGEVLRAWNAGRVHRPQIVRGAGAARSSGPACPYYGPGAPKRYVSRTCKGFLLSVAWQDSPYTPVRPSGARTRRRFMVAVEAKRDQPRRNTALASWAGCGTTPVEGAPPLIAATLGANSDRVRLGFFWHHDAPPVGVVHACWDFLVQEVLPDLPSARG